MSRSRKRVWITYSGQCSRFIGKEDAVGHHFEEMMEGKKNKLLEMEMKLFAKKS